MTLASVDIPWGYDCCFNANCQLRDKCLHYQAYLLRTDERAFGPAIYPDALKNGACKYFREAKPEKMAWGFTHLYDNIPPFRQSEARRSVHAYLGSGMGVYYRYHHGERLLSPRKQQDILNILAMYGSTDGVAFDHYVTAFDFSLK